MASAFVFTHARRASEAQALEALRRDLLERGRARFKSVLRAEAALRDKAASGGGDSGSGVGGVAAPAGTPSAARLRPLRGCAPARPARCCTRLARRFAHTRNSRALRTQRRHCTLLAVSVCPFAA
jgi:hypothetical protein